MKREKALSVLRMTVTALTALLCAALCAGVLTLYLNGLSRRAALMSSTEPIFTREAAGQWLLAISPLAALWLLTAISARLLGAGGERQRVKLRAPVPPMGQEETKGRRLIRGALYALAALLIALGVLNGGLRDVLVKAIHICTECIGLG